MQQNYWRSNLKILSILLSIWFIVSFGFGIIWSDFLDQFQIGGFKLGFWFAQQGSIYLFVILIFIYINFKILIRIFQFIFIKRVYNNLNENFGLIISINVLLFLYLRSLVENSISYYNIDFLIFLMCLYIIDKERKII